MLPIMAVAALGDPSTPRRVLVVTVTKGYRHDSIQVAEPLLADIAAKDGGFEVDYARTDDDLAAKMTPAALAGYAAVVFANTTGDLPLPDKDAFIEWVGAGHAFVGMHAATDTFHNYPPYIEMVGGEFENHREQVPCRCLVADTSHPTTAHIGSHVDIPLEEMYLIKNYGQGKVHLLVYMDRHPNDGNAGFYPLSWCRPFGQGRVWYTGLGHRDDVWTAPWFVEHIHQGVRWALGFTDGDDTPSPQPEIPAVSQ